MALVSREQAEELYELISSHGVSIKSKHDGYDVWWHQAASWFVIAMFWVFRIITFGGFSKDFNRDFFTTYGNTIYATDMPEDMVDIVEWLRDFNNYRIIRHEFIHVLQKDHYGPVVYATLYLVILPAFITFRSKFEFEAYTQQMICDQIRFGFVRASTVKWIESQFSSPSYLFMDVRKRGLRKKLEVQVEQVEQGSIHGLWPYRPDLLS